jgi:hypothetical protein
MLPTMASDLNPTYNRQFTCLLTTYNRPLATSPIAEQLVAYDVVVAY